MTETEYGERPWRDAAVFVQRLSERLDSFDWAGAESICCELIERLNRALAPFPEDPAKQILAMLRKKRQLRLMGLVADALIRSGQSAPQIRRQYAQAMIDQGNLTSPEKELSELAADSAIPRGERVEANGLLGRIYKQLYVNGGDPQNPRQQENLRKAMNYYYEVYRSDPQSYLWHGINVVALLARARRDKIPVNITEDEGALAQLILSEIAQKSDPDGVSFWDRATSVEANVALNRFAEATDQLLYFISDRRADAFETTNLYRQLTEVWQIPSDSRPGSELLTILRAAHLKCEGGHLELKQADIAGGLEAVFGRDRYEPFSWLQTGMKRCTAVARIDDVMGRRVGSGFLLDPSDFFESVGDAPLLLTNFHVISPASDPCPNSIQPDSAVAVFEALNAHCRIKEILWHSRVEKLDATLMTLAKMEPAGSPCPLKPAADPFDPQAKPRVYVIGYPLGGPLSISLQDSEWLDRDDRVLHYRTPTDPGSSGSPVFDQKYWTVIGLHHKGKTDMPRLGGKTGTYEANEAISIAAIRDAIRQEGIKHS
jgi:hypothetical protein